MRRRARAALLGTGALATALLAAELLLRATDAPPAPPPALRRLPDGSVEVDPSRAPLLAAQSAWEPERLRVVWLGDSTAAGVPWDPECSPPKWLAETLALRGASARVLPVAGPGLDSAGLLELLPEVLELEPDVLILTTGHNEYLRTARLLDAPRWMASRLLVRLAGLLDLRKQPVERLPTPEHDFDHAAIEEAFTGHLRDMQALCDGAGVELLATAPVCNLRDMPPVLDFGGARESWEAGRALLAQGDIEGARAALIAARDGDRWPHRATSALHAGLRDAVLVVIDVPPDGLSGFELFEDWCHPTPEGQRRMAIAVADALLGPGGEGPALEATLSAFGVDNKIVARAHARVGRTLASLALAEGAPGPLADIAEQRLAACERLRGRASADVELSRAWLALARDDGERARQHLAAASALAPQTAEEVRQLARVYPWVEQALARAGLSPLPVPPGHR